MKTKKKYGTPESIRISSETNAILEKYFPNLNRPAQIAQMAWEFDQMKQAKAEVKPC